MKKTSPAKSSAPKPIGVVTHYYGHLGVAIVKFNKPVIVGMSLEFRGATTNFTQALESMQFDHKPVTSAAKGKEIGVKVGEKVRDGDEVFGV